MFLFYDARTAFFIYLAIAATLPATICKMYLTSLPDHTNPGFDEQSHFSNFKKHNIVFNALTSSSRCDDHVGCLSFKTVLSGEEWYGVNNRRLAVRPGQFLILNDDQRYSSSIGTVCKVRSLSIFFEKQFASSVFFDGMNSDDVSLDNPFGGGRMPEFFQTLSNTGPGLHLQLSRLISALDNRGYDRSMMDEYLAGILHHLIGTHHAEAKRTANVNAVKPASRTEIYKRLCIAKDLLHSSFTDKLDLNRVAGEACLSVPQLVRQFKTVFRNTPHQYLISIRLTHAAELLKHTPTPIHEITWMCGFENISAFCRIFKIAYGVQPLKFRAMNK